MQQENIDKYIVRLENGALRIANTRVSLDSVVYAYNRGESPAEIKNSFPVLTLAQIYGGIAFYLENQVEIDEHLKNSEIKVAAIVKEQNERDRAERPEFYARFEEARRRLHGRLKSRI